MLGRPVKSEIRQNIVEILFHLKKGYAYQVYKVYSSVFPKVTMRSVYYHLKKGVSTGEFEVKEIKGESGEYSWGPQVERTYYVLGEHASASGNILVKEYLDRNSY